jgi:hypothetical protein
MATFLSPTDVICEIDRIVVRDDGEALGGSEPYLWSVFFKIDGDTVSAAIDIGDAGVTLSLSGEGTVSSPDVGSHGNLDLPDGAVDAGGLLGTVTTIDVPAAVGQFKTKLTPLPTTITIDPDSWIAEVVDDVVLSLQDIIDALSGDDLCPPPADDPSQLLGTFGTEFVTDVVGGLPGAFGALYLLMEEDNTAEDTAEDARRALRDAFKDELTNTVIPAVSITNQAPSDAAMEEIEIRMKQAVTDVIVAGINWWWVLLFGIFAVIANLDQDDPLGQATPMLTHLDLVGGGDPQEIDEHLLPEGGNGDWSLRGKIGLDLG